MSYRKISDRKYRFEVEKTVDGKRYRKSKVVKTDLKGKDLKVFLFTTDLELEETLEDEMADIHGFNNFTFQQLAEYYLENADIEVRTKDFYRDFLKNRTYDKIGNLKVREIKKADIEEYLNYLRKTISDKTNQPLSYKTIKHYLTTIKVMLNYAVDLEIIDKSPADRIRLQKKDEPLKRKFYSIKELNQIIPVLQKHSDTYHFLAFIFTIYAGIRPGELHGLQWDRVDLEKGIVQIDRAISRTSEGDILKSTKTRDHRTFQISPFLIYLFKKHKQEESLKFIGQSMDDKFVFSNSQGGVVAEKHFNEFYKEFCQEHDIRYITWYGLRHTAATILASKRVPAPNIAKRLGHTDPSTTQIYIHAVEDIDKEVKDIMDKVTTPKVISL